MKFSLSVFDYTFTNHNVLWVHIEGLGGYFISYRKLEQWIAACHTLIRFCPNLETLNTLWLLIHQESQRYTKEAFFRLAAIWQQRQTYLCDRYGKMRKSWHTR